MTPEVEILVVIGIAVLAGIGLAVLRWITTSLPIPPSYFEKTGRKQAHQKEEEE